MSISENGPFLPSMTTLEQTLHGVSQYLPPALVSEECLSHIREVVRGLPDAIGGCFGFECSLSDVQPVADFGLQVKSFDRGGAILAGSSSEHPLPERLSSHPIWRRVRRLCEEWGEPDSPLQAHLRQIWLVFDTRGRKLDEDALPNIFVNPRVTPTGDRAYLRSLERNIALLRGSDLPSPVHRSLDRCLALLTDGLHIAAMGVLLGRRSDVLRVCIEGVGAEQLPWFLESIKWNGPRDEACASLLPFGRCPNHVTLDVGEDIGPRLGVECFVGEPNQGPVCKQFLDDLVDRDLCLPAKRDALLGWTDSSFDRTGRAALPDRVLRSLWLQRLQASAVLVPSVGHIKLSFERGRPLEAKAYFGFVDRWRVEPVTLIDSGFKHTIIAAEA